MALATTDDDEVFLEGDERASPRHLRRRGGRAAELSADKLVTLHYTLHVDGATADKIVTAVTLEVQKRLAKLHGSGVTKGKRTVFSVTTPIPGRLSVAHGKESRGGDTYSEIGIILSAS